MAEIKIMPCPFPHDNPEHQSQEFVEYYTEGALVKQIRLKCCICNAEGPCADSENMAIEKWNNRVHDADLNCIAALIGLHSNLIRDLKKDILYTQSEIISAIGYYVGEHRNIKWGTFDINTLTETLGELLRRLREKALENADFIISIKQLMRMTGLKECDNEKL